MSTPWGNDSLGSARNSGNPSPVEPAMDGRPFILDLNFVSISSLGSGLKVSVENKFVVLLRTKCALGREKRNVGNLDKDDWIHERRTGARAVMVSLLNLKTN